MKASSCALDAVVAKVLVMSVHLGQWQAGREIRLDRSGSLRIEAALGSRQGSDVCSLSSSPMLRSRLKNGPSIPALSQPGFPGCAWLARE